MKSCMVVCVSCLFIFMSTGTCFGVDTAKKESIDELLYVSGATQMVKMITNAVTGQMTTGLKKLKPEIDPKAFDIVGEEIRNLFEDEQSVKAFLEEMYPVYDKYFSHDDITEMIKFYKSPIGKKVVSVMPMLNQESMIAGQKWSEKILPELQRRVLERLKEENIEIQ